MFHWREKCPGLIALALALTACGRAAVTGQVLDVFGKPVSGAAITVDGTAFSAMSDDNGRYEIQYVPGQFKIHIKKDGFVNMTLPFSVTQATEVPAAAVTLFPKVLEAGVYYV